jgi:hypothetical protein
MVIEDGMPPVCSSPETCEYCRTPDLGAEKEVIDNRRSYIVVQEPNCVTKLDLTWHETIIGELSPQLLERVVAWSRATDSVPERDTLGFEAVVALESGAFSGSPDCTCGQLRSFEDPASLPWCRPCNELSSQGQEMFATTAFEGVSSSPLSYTVITKAISTISERGEPWLECPMSPGRREFIISSTWSLEMC